MAEEKEFEGTEYQFPDEIEAQETPVETPEAETPVESSADDDEFDVEIVDDTPEIGRAHV